MEYLFGTKKNAMDSISSNQKDKLLLLTTTQNKVMETKDIVLMEKPSVKTIGDLMKENKKIIIKPREQSVWTIENNILAIDGNGIIESYLYVFSTKEKGFVLFYMTTGHTFKVRYDAEKDIMFVNDGNYNMSFDYELRNDQ